VNLGDGSVKGRDCLQVVLDKCQVSRLTIYKGSHSAEAVGLIFSKLYVVQREGAFAMQLP
jgi:hypothetical protein